MATTDEELKKTYSNGLLPSSPPGASDRDSNGILKKDSVDMIVRSLKRSGVIPLLTNIYDYETYARKIIKGINQGK